MTDNNVPAKTDFVTHSVTVDQGNLAPVSVPGGPYTADLGSGVTLNGSGSSDPNASCGDSSVSYEWDIDNDGTYEATGVSVSLSAAQVSALGLGTHTIRLRVTDEFGAANTANGTLNIYDNRPFASFTASPNPAACSQSISFNGSASSHGRPDRAIVSYAWEFGDGNVGSGVAVTHAYSAYGTYTAKLTVTDNNVPAKTDFVTHSVTVDQGNQAPVSVPGGPYTTVVGSGVSLNGSGSSDPNASCGDSIVQYDWSIDSGVVTATGANPTLPWAQISVLGVGSHTVSLAVTDTFGATGNAATTLAIDPTPPTLGTYPDTSIALSANATVTPDVVPTNATSINVSSSTNFKGTFSADPATGVVRVTNAHPAGVYTVTVKATGPGGFTTQTFTLTVTTGTACTDLSNFTNAANVNPSTQPYSPAVGDFNNDGFQDLAIPNGGYHTVSIRLGNGSGGFTSPAIPDVNVGNYPYSIAIGDFNGDGNQDIATTSFYTNVHTVSIRLGNGAGGFTGTTEISMGSRTDSIAIGDVNGDGKPDLVVANYDTSSVSVLLGDGDGTFTAAANVSVGAIPFSVAIGDLDGDGYPDLAVANFGSATVSIRLGNGSGGFSGSTNVAVGSGPMSVAIGDFNGDGYLDFAAASQNTDKVSVRFGNAGGTFPTGAEVSVGSNPMAVAIGDFNNDGSLDIAAVNFSSHTVSIRLGNGLGVFIGTTNVAVGQYPRGIAIGDFNGDGIQDFASANYGSSTASIRLGTCNPAPTITAATGLSRQQGSAGNSQIATVSDDGGNGSVTVTVNGGASSTVNGVTVSNIVNNPAGTITANIVASCGASNATFTLQASDGSSATTDTLSVTVTANTAPALVYPSPQAVAYGGALNVTPTAASDNGSVTGYAVQAGHGLTTEPTVDSSGVVSITNAQPAGAHTITVRATDNCGAFTDATFTLNVGAATTFVTISGNIQQYNFPAANTNLAGVTVTLAGDQTGSTSTDASGNYSFVGLASGGNYVIRPSLAGYNFDPISRSYSNVTSDVTTANFTGFTGSSPRVISAVSQNVSPGAQAVVPITMSSQGNENSIGFSASYDPAVLSSPVVAVGTDCGGCNLIVNDSTPGVVGITVSRPAGQLFTISPPARQVVTITFNTTPTPPAYTGSVITFGNTPVFRVVTDVNADPLLADYSNGVVTFAMGYESDVAPRPTGDRSGMITVADYTQTGRFAAGLDTVNPLYNELQRADMAPRATLGNGTSSVADYTQAGRYAAGLDPVLPAGGTAFARLFSLDEMMKEMQAHEFVLLPRVLRAADASTTAGQQVTVSFQIEASGDENGFGFTISYDGTNLSNPVVSTGADLPFSTPIPNTSIAGKVGVITAWHIFGGTIPAGTREIVKIRFDVSPTAPTGQTPIIFTGFPPVANEVSDALANVLPTTFTTGFVNILDPTAANTSVGGIVMSANGRAIINARLSLEGPSGFTRTALSNGFGFYRFDDVAVGETYVISVRAKNFFFTPRALTVVGEVTNLNLVADP